jgi:hypothetical protein
MLRADSSLRILGRIEMRISEIVFVTISIIIVFVFSVEILIPGKINIEYLAFIAVAFVMSLSLVVLQTVFYLRYSRGLIEACIVAGAAAIAPYHPWRSRKPDS